MLFFSKTKVSALSLVNQLLGQRRLCRIPATIQYHTKNEENVSGNLMFGPLHYNSSPGGFLTFQPMLEMELVIDLCRPAGLSVLWSVLPSSVFLLWKTTAFFIAGHLPENNLLYWLPPLSQNEENASTFLPVLSSSPVKGWWESTSLQSRGWVFLTVMQGTLVYLTLWVTE